MLTNPKAGDKIEIKHTGENLWHPAEVASVAPDGRTIEVSLRPGRSILCQSGAFSGLIVLRKDESNGKWLNTSSDDEFAIMAAEHK